MPRRLSRPSPGWPRPSGPCPAGTPYACGSGPTSAADPATGGGTVAVWDQTATFDVQNLPFGPKPQRADRPIVCARGHKGDRPADQPHVGPGPRGAGEGAGAGAAAGGGVGGP